MISPVWGVYKYNGVALGLKNLLKKFNTIMLTHEPAHNRPIAQSHLRQRDQNTKTNRHKPLNLPLTERRLSETKEHGHSNNHDGDHEQNQ